MAVLDNVTITNGALGSLLLDQYGNPIPRRAADAIAATDSALPMAGRNDYNYRHVRVDRVGGLALAYNNMLLNEVFEGATISASRVTSTATTFVPAQTATQGWRSNPTTLTTASAVSVLKTLRQFPKYQRAPLQARFRASVLQRANCQYEFGFGDASGVTAIPVGAYFQVTTGGVVQAVVTFNGTDTTVGAAISGLDLTTPKLYTWDIVLDDDEVAFFVQDTATGLMVAERRFLLPATQARLWNASHLPAFARHWNATAPASAGDLAVTDLTVLLLDANMNRPWGHVQSASGYPAHVNPTAFTQAATWANSATPGSSTLSNTTPGAATLGGLFQFAAVAGAATDYVLFGYQNPSPYTLYVTSVEIETWNTGAAVATTPHLLVWGVGVDQLAASLAGTVMRVPIGAQSFPIGAAIGAKAERVVADFSASPLVTHPGRFFDVILRMPVATNTASQILQGMVSIKGYQE